MSSSKDPAESIPRSALWKKFEMASFESPAPEAAEHPFVPIPGPEEVDTDFLLLAQTGDDPDKVRMQAEEIIRRAEQKAAHIRQEAALLEQKSYEEGYAQGEKDGLEIGEKRASKLIENMEELLAGIGRLRAEIIRQYEKEILDLVFAVSRKLIHRHLLLDDEAVKETVLQALNMAVEKRSVIIKVNPDDYDVVDRLRPTLFAALKDLKTVSISADPCISRGGCVLETPYGEVDASVETRLEAVHRSLDRAFSIKES